MPSNMTAAEAVRAYIEAEYYPEDEPTPLALLERYHVSSVVPGICMDRECQSITDRCEPDAVTNWCHECHGQTVTSLTELLLEVAL